MHGFLSKIGISYNLSLGILTGIIELTNGLQIVSNGFSTNSLEVTLVSAFLLGFGGFSVLLQVFSIISKSKISIKPYLYGKLLHGGFATVLSLLFWKIGLFI